MGLWPKKTSDYKMGKDWLKSYHQQDDGRNTYEGIRWTQWPVKKVANEAASFNSHKLKKKA